MAVSLSELRNPAPGLGVSLSGNHYRHFATHKGPPSLSMFSRPSTHVRTGQAMNASVSIGIRIRPFHDDMSTLGEGHILFSFRDQNNKHKRENDLLTCMNPSRINYCFEKNATKTGSTTSPLDERFPGPGEHLEDFANSFQFLGVTKTNVGPGARVNQAFSVDVYGRSNIRNIWGKVICGDTLWLEVSKNQIPGHRRLRPDEVFIGSVRTDSAEGVYQMRGVINPSLEHGEHKDDRLLVPIGVVGVTPTATFTPSTGRLYGKRFGDQAVRTDSEYSSLPFVSVFIGIMVPLQSVYLPGSGSPIQPPVSGSEPVPPPVVSMAPPPAPEASPEVTAEAPAPKSRGRRRVKRS